MTQPDRDLRAEVKSLAVEVQAAIDDVPQLWPTSSIFADIVRYATTLNATDSCRLVSDSWDAAVAVGKEDSNHEKMGYLFAAANSLCHAAKNAQELEASLNANMREPKQSTLHASYEQKYDTMVEIVRLRLGDYWAIDWNNS